MSQKQVKKNRKDREAEWTARRTQFLKEAQALSEKYRVDVVPRLVTTQVGITESVVRATMDIVDVLDQYEHVEPAKDENAWF